MGSKDSLNLHIELSKCKNLEIFATESLSHLLDYKWNLAFRSALIKMIFYWVLLLMVTVHEQNMSNHVYYYIIMVMCFIIFIWFCVQTFAGQVKVRETDIWQFLDPVFTVCYITYMISLELQKYKLDINHTAITIEHRHYYKQPFAIMNLIIWIRAISFLRIFNVTRIFIFVFVEMAKALKGFMAVWLMLMLGAGTSYTIIQGLNGNHMFLPRIIYSL